MGGHALSLTSVRLPAARYRVVERAVLARLAKALPGRRIEAVMAYAAKADFGDLDILIEGGAEAKAEAGAGAVYNVQQTANALQACEVVENGDVTSIGIQIDEGIFQVDLIQTPAASFDFAVRYFGFNDMGNLLGRVAHKFGAKFGHLGLLYPIRDAQNSFHLLAEVPITSDFGLALRLLGYDSARYESLRSSGGFQGLSDIFTYVVSSPYVNRDIYLLENKSHKARIRDAKRPTYNAFLDWLAQQSAGSLPAYPGAEAGSPARETQQQAFLQAAFELCPPFKTRYQQTLASHARKSALKQRFNGERVAAVTGLSGKALGALMASVRRSFADEAAFEDFFLLAGDAEIEACLLRHARAAEEPKHNMLPV